MKHDTIALIRVVLLVFLVLALIGLCIVEAGSASTTITYLEETTQETQPDTEPPLTIPTKETAAPETKAPTIATEPTTQPTEDPPEEWMNLGTYNLTAYCPCKNCCGKDPSSPGYGITSTGATATAGTTIAVDPQVIPYGSEVKINGHIYIAQDTGGAINGNRIDVYFDGHQEALIFGIQKAEVFIKTTAS